MTEEQYIRVQQELKARNANLLPPYYKINEIKKELMPAGITNPNEGTFQIPMQNSLDHQMDGIIDPEIREKIEEFALDPNNVFEAVVKYGSDGFSQNPQYRNSEIDQKTIYASYFVILMIKVKNTVSQKSNYFFVNQMSNSWTAISYLRLSYEEESYGKI